MNSSDPANAKPTKRALQSFSLRAFLLLIAGLCIWFAIVGNRARRQRVAADAVRAAGGLVAYAYHVEQNVKSLDEGEPPGPAWLREMLGIDFLSDVVFVQVTNPQSDIINKLRDLPTLERLGVFDAQLNDIEIEGLCRLQQLQRLLILTKGSGSLPSVHVEALQRALPHTEITGDL